jgi:hypothetical protein
MQIQIKRKKVINDEKERIYAEAEERNEGIEKNDVSIMSDNNS